jgi:hypothetical protein
LRRKKTPGLPPLGARKELKRKARRETPKALPEDLERKARFLALCAKNAPIGFLFNFRGLAVCFFP